MAHVAAVLSATSGSQLKMRPSGEERMSSSEPGKMSVSGMEVIDLLNLSYIFFKGYFKVALSTTS